MTKKSQQTSKIQPPITTTITTTSPEPSPTFTQLVDKDEVSHQVCRQLNEIFAGDPGNLWRVKQLLQDLENTRQDLQQRLQFTTTAAPDKITRAVKSAETALGDTRRLLGEAATLQDLVTAHTERVGGLLGAVGEGVRRVGELQRVEAYQALVSTVEEWSHDISSALHIGAEGQALVGYTRLVGGAATVKGSGCSNLRAYVGATLLHWNKALLRRFVGEFEGVLKSIKWPLSDGEVGGGGGGVGGGACHPPPPPEAIQRLCTLTQYLLQLSLPDDVAPPEEECPPSPQVTPPPLLSNFDPPLLPIQLLLNPLQVRFLYHFSGGRVTNSRSHPEWFFIQLLKWAGSHDHLLTHRLQPVLERCGRAGVSAKVEFLKGLTRLAAIKLNSHLSELSLDEDDLFAHTVQETLHFERELCARHGYPRTQPSILCVLTKACVFQRWLGLERKFAVEVMDELVSAEGAWETNYNSGGGGGGGGGETARCGEQVILLLQGITDRYKNLPQPGHRLQFLDLQLDLLDDFRVRLLQVRQGALRDPLTSAFPALLNTAHHLSSTLADWADLPFFIEMQYYQETISKAHQRTTTTTTTTTSPSSSSSSSSTTTTTISSSSSTLRQRHQPPTSTSSSPPPSSSSPPPPPPPSSSPARPASSASPGTPVHLQEQPSPPTPTQLAEVTGSVFDSVRTLYTHMEGEMVHTLAMYVFSEVRARSQPYRRDRWHRTQADMHADTDAHERRKRAVKISEASPSVCPLLEVLARHLHSLRDTLATPLFHRLWVEVAETLDKYVLEEVVLETRFSHGGAHQFKFDMAHALYPIFGEFTQRPDSYFRRIKESTTLLTLPLPTVLLLQDALNSTATPTSDSSSGGGGGGVLVPPRRALGEHGVTLLTPPEAAAVLNARIYDLE